VSWVGWVGRREDPKDKGEGPLRDTVGECTAWLEPPHRPTLTSLLDRVPSPAEQGSHSIFKIAYVYD